MLATQKTSIARRIVTVRELGRLPKDTQAMRSGIAENTVVRDIRENPGLLVRKPGRSLDPSKARGDLARLAALDEFEHSGAEQASQFAACVAMGSGNRHG